MLDIKFIRDNLALVKENIDTVNKLQKGEEPTVNDTTSYDNGVKVVPADLLTPKIVTKDNAAEVYKDDDTLYPLTQG